MAHHHYYFHFGLLVLLQQRGIGCSVHELSPCQTASQTTPRAIISCGATANCYCWPFAPRDMQNYRMGIEPSNLIPRPKAAGHHFQTFSSFTFTPSPPSRCSRASAALAARGSLGPAHSAQSSHDINSPTPASATLPLSHHPTALPPYNQLPPTLHCNIVYRTLLALA
jgi:hypothetical protein